MAVLLSLAVLWARAAVLWALAVRSSLSRYLG
jgi:hypothetical protein